MNILKSEFIELLKSTFDISESFVGGSIPDDHQREITINGLNMSSIIIETNRENPIYLSYIYTEASFVDKDIQAITMSISKDSRWVVRNTVMDKWGKTIDSSKTITENGLNNLIEFFKREETGISEKQIKMMSRHWSLENIIS